MRDLAQLATQTAANNIRILNFTDSTGPDLWHLIGQAIPTILEASPDAVIFKIAQLPTKLFSLLEQLTLIADQSSLKHATMARASGVLYFALLPQSNDEPTIPNLHAAANQIFTLCTQQSVNATVLFCPTKLKSLLNIWGPTQPNPTPTRALKSAFDPHNIFAPGRFVGGV
jgi:hypothetical protein